MIIDPDEIDALKLESRKTIGLVLFVDAAEIDDRHFERPCVVDPADALAGEGKVAIRDGLARTGRIARAQVTMAGRSTRRA